MRYNYAVHDSMRVRSGSQSSHIPGRLQTSLRKTFEDRVADHVLTGDLQGLQTLAESEFHRVYNAAVLDGGHQYQSSVGYGVTKNWYTVMDDKVRETHRYLEGASVSLDEEFWTFDGDHAAYPGGFTKAENNVNCRCTVELHIDAEEE